MLMNQSSILWWWSWVQHFDTVLMLFVSLAEWNWNTEYCDKLVSKRMYQELIPVWSSLIVQLTMNILKTLTQPRWYFAESLASCLSTNRSISLMDGSTLETAGLRNHFRLI